MNDPAIIRAAIVRILTDEGGAPGHTLHGARCTWPGRPPCDCLAQVADRIVAEVVAPLLVGTLDDREP